MDKKIIFGSHILDEEIKEIIFKILDTKTQLSIQEWEDIINKYGNNDTIVTAILKADYVQIEVLDKLLSEKNLKVQHYLQFLTRTNIKTEYISNIILPAIPDNELINFLKKCVNEKKIIAQKYLRCIMDSGKVNSDIIYRNISSPVPIEKTLKKAELGKYSEEVMHEIANNPFISDSLRNKAFNFGCNILSINNPTSEMSNQIITSALECIFESDKNSPQYKEDSFECILLIKRLLNGNFLSEKNQLKIIEYCNNYDFNDDYYDTVCDLLLHIADKTKNPKVVDMLSKSDNDFVKDIASYNEYMSKETGNEIVDELITSLPTRFIKKAHDDINKMSFIIGCVPLKNETYRKIINSNEEKLLKAIASSEHTPKDFLLELVDYPNDFISLIAELNVELLQTGILHSETFRVMINIVSKEKKIRDDYLITIDNEKTQKIIVEKLYSITKNMYDNSLKTKILNYINELIEKSNRDINIIKSMFFKYNLETNSYSPDYEILRRCEETKIINFLKKMDIRYLKNLSKQLSLEITKIKDELSAYLMYDGYEKINRLCLDEISKKERNKNGKEKENDEYSIEI